VANEVKQKMANNKQEEASSQVGVDLNQKLTEREKMILKNEQELVVKKDEYMSLTDKERISRLDTLSKKESLNHDQKIERDALWLTMEKPVSKEWESMRDKHIDSIVDKSASSLSFWIAEGDWGDMSDIQRENFLQKTSDRNNQAIGNPKKMEVDLYSNPNPKNNGAYNNKTDKISINKNSEEFNSFYSNINTITHEGAGHGYQDYVIEDKSVYLKNKPEMKDQVKKFELSYDDQTWPNKEDQYLSETKTIYLADPSEVDAFYVGDSVQNKMPGKKQVILFEIKDEEIIK
jgi:hypothetical protein